MFKFITAICLSILLLCCNNSADKDKKTEDTTSGTTGDTSVRDNSNTNTTPATDEQGCKDMERWSKTKKVCVDLASLIKLDTKDPALDPAKPAYLLFDSVKVEIFLLAQASSVVIRKNKPEEEIWQNGPLKLSKTATGYRLEDEGKLIYASGE